MLFIYTICGKINGNQNSPGEDNMLKSMRWWLIVTLVAAGSGLAMANSPAGNLRYSVSVDRFENRAGWRGQWDLGDAWGTIMTDQMMNSGHFIVLGESDMRGAAMREQDFAASGRVAGGGRAPAMGQMTPAQLLVKGAITHVQSDTAGQDGGLSFRGIRVGGGRERAEINATIYLVDTRTGQVKASTSVTGEAGRRRGRVGYTGAALGGVRGDVGGFASDNVGRAMEDAIEQAVEFLVAQLDAVRWEGTVVQVAGNRVFVNRGSREGVTQGQEFSVGSATEIVDPDTGEVLDTFMESIGTIRATEVRERLTICEAPAGVTIEPGMTIHPK